MRRWFDRDWYRYLWHRRMPTGAQATLVVGLATLVLVGGYFAAGGLVSASGGTSSGADAYILQTTTVTKVVTIKRNGKTIVRRVPVVRTIRIKAKATTVRELRTVTTPQGVKTVPVDRVRYVPVTKTVDRVVTNVVTKNGKTRTVVTTKPVTVQQTVPGASSTETRVVTNERTVTNTNTVASPPDTTTVTRTRETTTTVVVTSTQTETRVETRVETKTLPPDTTTVTVTQPITVTVNNPPPGG
jgi:hypothetical protein